MQRKSTAVLRPSVDAKLRCLLIISGRKHDAKIDASELMNVVDADRFTFGVPKRTNRNSADSSEHLRVEESVKDTRLEIQTRGIPQNLSWLGPDISRAKLVCSSNKVGDVGVEPPSDFKPCPMSAEGRSDKTSWRSIVDPLLELFRVGL